MEIIKLLDIGQLGISGVFIAYLIFQVANRDKIIKSIDADRTKCRERSLDIVRETQKELFESSKTFEKVMEALKTR